MTFGRLGPASRWGIGLLAALALFSIGATTPALADCTQVGTTITCSGASPGGFDAGVQNGLTVTVQPGAAVGTGIVLNDNNLVTNRGAVTVGDSTTAIASGNNNLITSSGSITAGEDGIGASIGGTGSIFNSGTVTVGNGSSIGLNAPTVTNTGTITVGDFGTGVFGTADAGVLINRGTIAVGDDASGIASNSNSLTIVNSGSITFGGCGWGINATGTGNVIVNSGTLAFSGCGGGGGGIGIQAGDSNTVTNTGTIRVGDTGAGIGGGNGTTVMNSGLIVAGDLGTGIQSGGNITNTGTIIVGAGIPGITGAIVGLGDGLRLINSGTIIGGSGATGISFASGVDGVLTNSGSIIVADSGVGMAAQGRATLLNSGTIVAGPDGIGMVGGGSDSTLTNSGTIIVGPSSGGPFSGGMIGDGNRIRLVNSGTIIVGEGMPAVIATGNDGVLINSGSIIVGNFGGGLISGGNRGRLTNTGTIVTGDEGIGIGSSGDDGTINNSGTIRVGACGAGIDTSPGTGSTIVNSGRILGSGCAATGVAMGDGDTLTNSGLVSAPFSLTSIGAATVTNTGTLDGAIALGAGSSLANSGLITVSTPLTAGNGVAHTIDGTFTQTPTGTLALRVMPDSSAGNYDTLAMTGVANLGGTLRPIAQPALYGPTTTYLGVLTFASSTGRFDTVAPASVFLTASAVYNAGSVDLVLTRLPFNSAGIGGGSVNTRAIGNVLEANYSTSLTGALATFYSQLLVATAPNILSQLTGEIATATPSASFTVFSQFLGTIFSQTSSTRTGNQAASSSGSQTALRRTTTTAGGTRLALAAAEECAGDACDTAATARRFTYWAQGFGGAASIDGNGGTGSARVDITTGGGATGIDLQVTPNLLLGVTMGTASAGFGAGDLLSYGSARAIVLGLYGGYSQGPFYLDGALAYGYDTFTTTRLIGTGVTAEMAYGAFDGHQYGGRVESGWRFGIEQHQLTPFAGFAVQALTQAGYSETSRNSATGAPGLLGVTVQGQTTTSVRSTLGLQFETALRASDDAVFKPRLRLGWAHEFNSNRSTTVALSVLPGAPFQVTGAQPATDALIVGAGFELELGRMVRLYGQFDGDFASTARAFSGTGGVRLIW